MTRFWCVASLSMALGGCERGEVSEPRSVAIELEPAAPALRVFDPEVDVRLSPCAETETWTDESPALFRGLEPGRAYQVQLPDRYLFAAQIIEPSARGVVHATVPVIPLYTTESSYWGSRMVMGHTLYLDTSPSEGPWILDWRRGDFVVSRRMIPRGVPGLEAVLTSAWESKGEHRLPKDRNEEEAVVLVQEAATYAEVLPIARVFSRFERTFVGRDDEDGEWRDRKEVRSGFRLRVVRASRAKPPPRAPFPAAPLTGPRPGLRTEIEFNGARTEAEIRAGVATLEPAILQCYGADPAASRSPGGLIRVRFVIDVVGAVHHVGNAGSDYFGVSMFPCVQRWFQKLHFEGIDPKTTTVVAALHFTPPRSP